MEKDAASRTAVLVGQGRAVAHGRMAVGKFDDPTATFPLSCTLTNVADEQRPSANAAYTPPCTIPKSCLCLSATSKRP